MNIYSGAHMTHAGATQRDEATRLSMQGKTVTESRGLPKTATVQSALLGN